MIPRYIVPIRSQQAIIKEELERVSSAIKRYPDGVNVERLMREGRLGLGKRTLQRRLSQLLKIGAITAKGEARAVKYFSAIQAPGISDQAQIPVSRKGAEIISYVSQPIQNREPVGYKAEFLEQYIPNKTEYLPKKLREQLAQIGSSLDGARPAGTFARHILDRLLIDLSWSSSRLEGNTYSRLDTQRLIEHGETAQGKDAIETQMILNHKAAIELLVDEAETIGFNAYTLLNLHAALSYGLLPDRKDEGRLRQRAVDISGSVYTPNAIPQKTEDYFRMLLEKATVITDPFEQAFFIMVHIPYLQPFADVNKRVSRVAANIPFIKNNLSPLSFIDLPERYYVDAILGVYEMNRIELLRDVFTWGYERSCQRYTAIKQNLVSPDPLRLRYRREISEVIQNVIRSKQPATKDSVAAAVPGSVRPEDVESLIELLLKEFSLLHEGNITRFRVRPSEFLIWKEETERTEPGDEVPFSSREP